MEFSEELMGRQQVPEGKPTCGGVFRFPSLQCGEWGDFTMLIIVPESVLRINH